MATREQILKDNEHLRGKMSDGEIIALAKHLEMEEEIELIMTDEDNEQLEG